MKNSNDTIGNRTRDLQACSSTAFGRGADPHVDCLKNLELNSVCTPDEIQFDLTLINFYS
jgi:hypothetical protein